MRKIFSLHLVTAMMFAVSSSLSFAEPHVQRGEEADVARPVAPPYYLGVLEFKPKEVGEEIRLCPFLKMKDGKTYRLRTYTESSCKEAIDNCKAGDRCVVKGEVSSEGDLFAEEFTSFSVEKTTSGLEFKRATIEDLKAARVKDTAKFGESWIDPSGMIWGDIAKKEDGTPWTMNHQEAQDYCKKLGAELPSGWPEDKNGKYGFPNNDSDFVRLRKYMGANFAARYDAPKGYTAQILPNLKFTNENGEILSRWHWSSSLHHPEPTLFVYVFDGRDGRVASDGRSSYGDDSVRCVVRAARVVR